MLEYQYTFDTSTLNSGLLTYSADVYPRIGASASILHSSDQTIETCSFCNQYAVKGPKYYIYVSSTGSDTTGVASTNAATAAASPVLTFNGAVVRARALMPGNRVSGLEIRLTAGTWSTGGVTFNTYQDTNSAEVVVTRDPSAARSAVIWTWSASNQFNLSYIRFNELTMTRTANAFLLLGGVQVVVSNVDIDLGGFAATLVNNLPLYYSGGVTLTNVSGSALLMTGKLMMFRGVQAASLGVTQIENWDIAGSRLVNIDPTSFNQNENGGMIEGTYFKVSSASSNGVRVGDGSVTLVSGYAIRNVLIEYMVGGGAPGPAFRISADGGIVSTAHIVLRGVTIAGAYAAGRANLGYDEASGTTRRTHKLWRVEGVLFAQINNKSDRFVYTNQSNTDGTNRVGGWSINYGVGWRGNVFFYPDAGNNDPAFKQDYPGLATQRATSKAAPINPLFTSNQAATFDGVSTYTAGAGGGTYTIGSSSPAKATVTGSMLIKDITGATRGATASTGAFE